MIKYRNNMLNSYIHFLLWAGISRRFQQRSPGSLPFLRAYLCSLSVPYPTVKSIAQTTNFVLRASFSQFYICVDCFLHLSPGCIPKIIPVKRNKKARERFCIHGLLFIGAGMYSSPPPHKPYGTLIENLLRTRVGKCHRESIQ